MSPTKPQRQLRDLGGIAHIMDRAELAQHLKISTKKVDELVKCGLPYFWSRTTAVVESKGSAFWMSTHGLTAKPNWQNKKPRPRMLRSGGVPRMGILEYPTRSQLPGNHKEHNVY